MHWIDLIIFVVYMLAMLWVGHYFLKKNKSASDYYVGGRDIGKWHIGLSVVATDVGGGFSIGLGGLGFTMGISGSWMLFTGLIGAWLAAVFLVPKIYDIGKAKLLFTFPQFIHHIYGSRMARLAGILSLIGYIGFTSSQLLAGAKLASATFPELNLTAALWIMGAVAVVYTAMGGLKAVIFTDTIQWIILMIGMIGIGLPMGYFYLGGWDGIKASLPPEFLRFDQLSWQQIVNWSLTVIPIWFVGMTLYQRIYASRSKEDAVKAWRIAGFLEWPVIALMGTLLGMMAKVAFVQGLLVSPDEAAAFDPEMGLPLFLSSLLPVGLMGLMMSAYFSAILSTADSCLMAASGNVVSDLLRIDSKDVNVRLSQFITLALGLLAIALASKMTGVLDLMLQSYAVMVSGLFIPVIAALFDRNPNSIGAISALVFGGGSALIFSLLDISIPFKLDPIVPGLLISSSAYIIGRYYSTSQKSNAL